MANVSDDKVKAATGRNWTAWLNWLDARGAKTMSHKEIVALLKPEDMSPWYRQTVAVTYEKKRQGRETHQMVDGYQASASKTINAPLARVEAAFLSSGFGPKGTVNISTHHIGKTIRGAWTGKTGGRIGVYLYDLGKTKSRITLNHEKLETAEECEAMKAAWRDGLSKMKATLET